MTTPEDRIVWEADEDALYRSGRAHFATLNADQPGKVHGDAGDATGARVAEALRISKGVAVGQPVSVVFRGVYDGYDAEVGHHFLRGSFVCADGSDHVEWTIEAHWAADLHASDATDARVSRDDLLLAYDRLSREHVELRAEVADLEADLVKYAGFGDPVARAEAAEAEVGRWKAAWRGGDRGWAEDRAKLRALRKGVEALADDDEFWTYGNVRVGWLQDKFRALLASSPAEATGEAECTCAMTEASQRTCAQHGEDQWLAPVSSAATTGEVGEPAFSVSQGVWTLTGSYDGPDNIRLYRDGVEHSRRTCEGYKIWNYAAHLSDLIAEIESAEEANPAPVVAPSGTEGGEGR